VSNNNVKRRKYKKDFLNKVIVRIDFDTPLPIATNGPAKGIYSTVKERFPITEEKKVIAKKRDSDHYYRQLESSRVDFFYTTNIKNCSAGVSSSSYSEGKLSALCF